MPVKGKCALSFAGALCWTPAIAGSPTLLLVPSRARPFCSFGTLLAGSLLLLLLLLLQLDASISRISYPNSNFLFLAALLAQIETTGLPQGGNTPTKRPVATGVSLINL